MRDGHRAVAAGAEGKLSFGIELRRVHALPDGHAGHYFAVRAIHHHHHLVAATQEQPLVRAVERHARRFFARCDRPRVHHFMFRGIDRHDFALVFEVVIDPLGRRVGHGKLWLAGQRDGGHHLTRLGVEHRRRLSPPIERVNFLLTRLE